MCSVLFGSVLWEWFAAYNSIFQCTFRLLTTQPLSVTMVVVVPIALLCCLCSQLPGTTGSPVADGAGGGPLPQIPVPPFVLLVSFQGTSDVGRAHCSPGFPTSSPCLNSPLQTGQRPTAPPSTTCLGIRSMRWARRGCRGRWLVLVPPASAATRLFTHPGGAEPGSE